MGPDGATLNRLLFLCLVSWGCADPAGTPALGGGRDAAADVAAPLPVDAGRPEASPVDVGGLADGPVADAPDGSGAGFYDDDYPAGPVDRAARPAVTFGLLPFERLDAYNQDHAKTGWVDRWSAEITEGLTRIDGLNGHEGDSILPPGGAAVVLVREYLLLHAGKPYAADGFLDRELVFGLLLPEAEASSGGRSLGQDVTDVILDAVVGNQMGTHMRCDVMICHDVM